MQEKARVQRFALLGIKVSSFKYFLGNLYIIIVIISILFYYLCVFRKNRRKFTKPAEFGGKTAGIGCSLIFSESTHIGLSFGTTLNILSQNEDFDGFCLLSNSTISEIVNSPNLYLECVSNPFRLVLRVVPTLSRSL